MLAPVLFQARSRVVSQSVAGSQRHRRGSRRLTMLHRNRPFRVLTLLVLLEVAQFPDSLDIHSHTSLASVGGTETPYGKYPTVGALISVVDGGASHPVCSAVMIDNRHALTAAHCIVLNSGTPLRLTLSKDRASEPQVLTTFRSDIHPDFTVPRGNGGPLHDIAVLTLLRPIADVVAASLPNSAPPHVDEPVAIVGFGPTTAMSGSEGVENDAVTSVNSVAPFEFGVYPEPNPQPCFGDSGGPAFSQGSPRHLIGIASRAAIETDHDCRLGAIYTRVDVHRNWILTILERSSSDADDKRYRIGYVAIALLVMTVGLWVGRRTLAPAASSRRGRGPHSR
jgi:hypothetical protein